MSHARARTPRRAPTSPRETTATARFSRRIGATPPCLSMIFLLFVTGCFRGLGGPGTGVYVESDDEGGSVTIGSPRTNAQPDRSRAPETGPVPSVRLPARTDFELDNGLRVILVRRARLPIVDIRIQLEGGATLQGPDRAGLAAYAADMLDEGTASRSALELADEVDRLGAILSTTASHDASTVRLTVLRPRLEPALELMADVVLSPVFAEADLERVRSERRTRVLQQLDQPGVQAGNALDAVLFGAAHPYGQPLLGTLESLEALRREDVLSLYAAQYRPSRATVIAVGDVTEEDLRSMLEARFGPWREGPLDEAVQPPPGPGEPERAASTARAAAPAPATAAARGRTLYIVDRPGAAQSEIRVGRVAVDRRTDDYFPLVVLNTVLGGSFTSRLNLVLREEKGYTYGAGSRFAMRRLPGPFVASSAVHTPVTDSAVVEFVREIERLTDEPVPAEELERAKNYVALRLAEQFETTSDVADRMAEVVLHDLPDDFFDGYTAAVLAVTASDVQRAARAHLDAREMAIVVVGDRAAIEEPLRRLELGDVIVLESPSTTPER
jgi:zinc protease